jgi:hypothetical protein
MALGHPVTAVDESARMLAHARGAQTVRSAPRRAAPTRAGLRLERYLTGDRSGPRPVPVSLPG